MADTRGTVLIVDDDPVSVEVLGDYLTRKQLAVVRAHTLDEALAELESERPEAAVVGVRVGETGELEVIKRIRQANVHVALLATAAPADVHLATAALGLGALDYLLKPIDFDYLSRAIEKALTAGAPVVDFADMTPEPTVSSPQTLLYTLALEVFRATRPLSPEARASVGTALEQGALQAMQRGVSGEKAEVIRALNHVRTLIRFSRDLGDLDAATATRLEDFMGRARRSVGLS
jgi:ActR/RegA family two-component response regulator